MHESNASTGRFVTRTGASRSRSSSQSSTRADFPSNGPWESRSRSKLTSSPRVTSSCPPCSAGAGPTRGTGPRSRCVPSGTTASGSASSPNPRARTATRSSAPSIATGPGVPAWRRRSRPPCPSTPISRSAPGCSTTPSAGARPRRCCGRRSGCGPAMRRWSTTSPWLTAQRIGDPALATSSSELPLAVDRVPARYSTWYELFPRSSAAAPGAHGTFEDVERGSCRTIAEMGFDVLYLPPIHPIGRDEPQGPEQRRWPPGPATSGSPWAIGVVARAATPRSHPDLGTLADFAPLVDRGRAATASRSRSTSPSSARPTTRGCTSTPSGSAPARRHDPVRREPAQALRGHLPFDFESDAWRLALDASCGRLRALDRRTGCGSSGSTTRTPSRSRSGSG